MQSIIDTAVCMAFVFASDALFAVLDLAGLMASLSLLAYSEEWMSAEFFADIDLLIAGWCLSVPWAADAVEKMATYVGTVRRLWRVLIGHSLVD